MNINSFEKFINYPRYATYLLDSFADLSFDTDRFTVFESINNIFYLVYAKRNLSLIFFNLKSKTLINEIKNAHKQEIISIKHYLDINNKRDLIFSVSYYCIKIWNCKNVENLLEFKKDEAFFYTSCILNYEDDICFIAGESNVRSIIEVYNLYGKRVKTITNKPYFNHGLNKDMGERIFHIESFYDVSLDKTFIIAQNFLLTKS